MQLRFPTGSKTLRIHVPTPAVLRNHVSTPFVLRNHSCVFNVCHTPLKKLRGVEKSRSLTRTVLNRLKIKQVPFYTYVCSTFGQLPYNWSTLQMLVIHALFYIY